jgi:hypothetical protein
MGVYDKIGKIVVFIFGIILIIGVLAYFGFITPEATEKPLSTEEQEIIQIFEQVNLEMGRYNVYLQENQFNEAKSSVLKIKLKLSDAEIKLNSINSEYKSDLKEVIDVYKPLTDGLNSLIKLKQLDNQKDILTWDKYNEMIKEYIDTRNKYADFYNKAILIQNEEVKTAMNLSVYNLAITNMDDELRDLQNENMTQLVEANTFISKINPTDSNVRGISANIEKTYGTEFNQRLVGIVGYFSENLDYVHMPNWNPGSNIQHIQSPADTLNLKGGNCADLSILFSSIAESIGISTMFCFADTTHSLQQVQQNSELFKSDHAVIQYLDENNNWLTLDPTCYAGVDLEVGDECNQKIDYVVKCYEVKEFKDALSVN